MTVNGTTRDSQALARAINNREGFASSGALSGEYVSGGADGDYGRYIVRSYAEPIAVVDYTKHRAYVTSRKFSVTTSRHQNTTRAALSRVLAVDETTVRASRIDTHGKAWGGGDAVLAPQGQGDGLKAWRGLASGPAPARLGLS